MQEQSATQLNSALQARPTIILRRAGFAVRCVVAILVTLAGIQYSFQHGRLIRRPVADDANYFVDGLHRLGALYQNGISGFIHTWTHDPPHSPFSGLLAMASFAIFGPHDWAPYAGNAIIIFALLTAVDWMAGNIPVWQRGLLYAMVISTRWPWTAVTEFRPDLAAGLALAVAVLFCLRSSFVDSSVGHRIGVGALFGLALVIKPSMGPVNLVLFAVCVIAAITVDLHTGLEKLRFTRIARAIVPTLVGAIFVSLPYYAFGWRTTWDYIYSNIFGDRREIWQQAHETFREKISYYLIRPSEIGGGLILSAGHVYLLIILALVGLALVLGGTDRAKKLRSIAIAIVGVVAYTIPTLAKTKNFYFGAGFQTLFLLGGVMVLLRLAAMKNALATATFVAVCVASMLLFQPPLNRGDRWSSTVVDSNRLLNQVYSAVQKGQFGDRIFVPAPGGSVSWNTMNYLSLCDDSLRVFANLDYGIWNDQRAIDKELDLADWVVAGDPGNAEGRTNLPTAGEGQRLYLASVRARSEFVESDSFAVGNGLYYHVFHRTTPAFSGFVEKMSSGLRGPDGPHAQWRLPITRAASNDVTRLSLSAGANHRVLVMSFICRVEGERVTVLLDAVPIISKWFDKGDSFNDLHVPVEVSGGAHALEIRYSKLREPGSSDPAILFRKLEILERKE